MIERAIRLAGLTEPTEEHPQPAADFDNIGFHKINTPGFWTLELAGKAGIDMANPNDTEPANYSTIIAALLTSHAGMDGAFRPLRYWSPREVALRMLPEDLKAYDKAISAVVDDLTAEIKARKGDDPNLAPATASKAGGGKPSRSRSTSKTSKG